MIELVIDSMVLLALSHTFEFPEQIDMIVPGPNDSVLVQVEQELFTVNPGIDQPQLLGKVDPGSQIIAIDGDQSVTFDNRGRLVYSSHRGAEARAVSFGEEVEFVAAKRYGSTLILLLADTPGNPLELGVPEFRLVAIDSQGATKSLAEPFERSPGMWLLNETLGQLIVFPDIETATPQVFNIESGERVEAPSGLSRSYRNLRVTGMDVAPDGKRLAVSLWNDGREYGEFRIVQIEQGSDKLVSILPAQAGVPSAPLWSPEGESFAFRCETESSSVLLVAWVDHEGEWQIQTISVVDPLGEYFWHGDQLVVQLDDTKIGVFARGSKDN